MVRTAEACGGGAEAAASDHRGRFDGVDALDGGSCEDLRTQHMMSINTQCDIP